MKKDFWCEATVGVLGGGNWGTVLAALLSQRVDQVRLWDRDEGTSRTINSTRNHPLFEAEFTLAPNVTAMSDPDRFFSGGLKIVFWAIPSSVSRQVARSLCRYFTGEEMLIHATKGVEPVTLRRISKVLKEELPVARVGVVSGPNLAKEIAQKMPASTLVASKFDEVVEAGKAVLHSDLFHVYGSHDLVGVEWAGTLKNVLAIASGATEGAGLGYNARSSLIAKGIEEMIAFGTEMGGEEETFRGLAGIGDVLATCTPLSRNYQVGFHMAQGKSLTDSLQLIGSTAEGVATAKSVAEFARERGIAMPITEAVYDFLEGRVPIQRLFQKCH